MTKKNGRNHQTFLLRRYLTLRGICIRDIATGLGLNYHTIQKTITGVRSARAVRESIADYLGVPYRDIWGVAASRRLTRLIDNEINQQAARHREELRERYLDAS